MFSKSQFDDGSQFSTSLPVTALDGETYGIIPLTLNQISDISVSDDVDVTVVANVSNIVENYSTIIFTLDDGTGKLICERLLIEQSDRLEMMEEIREGLRVRVVGNLKSFNGGMRLVVFSFRPVTNSDETAFHLSACTDSHTHTSKAEIQGDRDNNSVPLCVDGVYEPTVQMVLDYLQHPERYTETGFHINEIEKELKLPANKIMDCIRVLEEEGVIYSTVDMYHYKAVYPDNLLSSTQNTSIQNVTNGSTPTFLSQDSVPLRVDGVNEIYLRLVLDYLLHPKNFDTGIHIDEIVKELKLPVNKIRKAIRILEDEGMIYTAIDELHFKAA